MATQQPKPEILDTGDDPAVNDMDKRQKLMAAFGGVIARLSRLARARPGRSQIEQRWLQDSASITALRHEATEGSATPARSLEDTPGKSRAIINMTRPKTKAWAARLGDLLFPADDKNWGISPTPVPELTEKAKAGGRPGRRQAPGSGADGRHPQPRRRRPAPRPCPRAALEQAVGARQEALEFEQAEAEARASWTGQALRREHGARDRRPADRVPVPAHLAPLIDDLCKLGSA
jgi:hypothetical protein